MINKDLGYYIKKFLDYYLPSVRNLSTNTIHSYRDTIKLFLKYNVNNSVKIENANIELLNKENILRFLDSIENERTNSINTRNQRLACLKSLCRFIINEENLSIAYIQDIFSIQKKKCYRKEIQILTKEEIERILAKPSLSSPQGKKELLILTLLYDAGLRVNELLNLKSQDIVLNNDIAKIRILKTKCNKSREVPITDNTKELVKGYITYKKLNGEDYLIQNNRNNQYTSNGIRKIISKYTTDINFKVTPHTFRHTKASHLVESGIAIIYIRDFLGHESLDTTLLYTKLNGKFKNETLINNSLELNNKIKYDLNNTDLLEWLEKL